jgi:hypothetical protein
MFVVAASDEAADIIVRQQCRSPYAPIDPETPPAELRSQRMRMTIADQQAIKPQKQEIPAFIEHGTGRRGFGEKAKLKVRRPIKHNNKPTTQTRATRLTRK